jgi:hypothetical protein
LDNIHLAHKKQHITCSTGVYVLRVLAQAMEEDAQAVICATGGKTVSVDEQGTINLVDAAKVWHSFTFPHTLNSDSSV